MADATQYSFSHQEIVEQLIKKQGIKEGEWQLIIKFSFTAANIGPDDKTLNPAGILGVANIGIQKTAAPSNLTVNAAKVMKAQKAKSKG